MSVHLRHGRGPDAQNVTVAALTVTGRSYRQQEEPVYHVHTDRTRRHDADSPAQPGVHVTHRDDQTRSGEGGYTLVEAMIVLVVMGIVGSIGLRAVSAGGYRADGVARVLSTAMQQAQRIAILRQYDVVVSFDSSRGRIRVFEDANNDRALAPGELVSWRSLDPATAFVAPGAGVDGAMATTFAVSTRTVEGYPSITFHRDGSASQAAAIYLRDRDARATTLRAVTVTRSTGRVRWFKGDGTRWIGGGS